MDFVGCRAFEYRCEDESAKRSRPRSAIPSAIAARAVLPRNASTNPMSGIGTAPCQATESEHCKTGVNGGMVLAPRGRQAASGYALGQGAYLLW